MEQRLRDEKPIRRGGKTDISREELGKRANGGKGGGRGGELKDLSPRSPMH